MNSRIALLMALFLLSQSGCITLPFQSPPPDAATPSARLELPPEKAAEVCLATARELDRLGQDAEAIAQYEKTRELNPKLTSMARRLAVLYDRQGDFVHALAEYRLAVQQTPRDADLLSDLGYCLYEQGNGPEAEKTLREALKINPDQKRAWGNLGLVLAQQERYAESYEAFAKVVSPGEAHANVGILQAQQGKTAEARASLRQALALAPDLKTAQAVLARVEGPAGTDARAARESE